MNELSVAYRKFFGVAPNPLRLFVTVGHEQRAGVSAYVKGHVFVQQGNTQVPPPVPYLVIPIIRPGAFQRAMGTISIFDRHDVIPGFTARIYEIQSQLEQLIPYEGVLLPVGDDGASIWIQRGVPFFPETIGDPNDRLVVQGLCNIVVADYT